MKKNFKLEMYVQDIDEEVMKEIVNIIECKASDAGAQAGGGYSEDLDEDEHTTDVAISVEQLQKLRANILETADLTHKLISLMSTPNSSLEESKSVLLSDDQFRLKYREAMDAGGNSYDPWDVEASLTDYKVHPEQYDWVVNHV